MESGLLPSTGGIGDAYDNAVIESFWDRVQTDSTASAGTPASNSANPPETRGQRARHSSRGLLSGDQVSPTSR
jgi:hypothetical protein